ncbi:MAG TPA: glycosyltransferase family 4 protein [Lacipirellulaceae bacterium]|nr:glycosyltransferase family 4 protein [Lacipirellulaceae bacterium]
MSDKTMIQIATSADWQRPSGRPCAVFVAMQAIALAKSRLPIMRELVSRGWRVVAVANFDEFAPSLKGAGIEFERISFHCGGLAPWRDCRSLQRLANLYRRLNPTLIHHFQVRPIIFGCAAARACPRAKVINTITGLGHAYTAGEFIRRLANAGYRLTLSRAECTIFQNPDDRQEFLKRNLVSERNSSLIISSGIDLDHFQPVPRSDGEPLRVVLPTRLLWAKGVGEFAEAARRLRLQWPHVHFQIAGPIVADHPNGVPRRFIEQWVAAGHIEHLGFVHNMCDLYHSATIVVLPSYYREGVPRVLLEAAACGVPVITCDSTGCREAAENNVTGLLVPPRNSNALEAAIHRLLSNPALRTQMGRAGRQRMERLFDQRVVVSKYLNTYRQIGVSLERVSHLSVRGEFAA